MSDIVSNLIASSKVIQSPSGDAAQSTVGNTQTTSPESNVPLLADIIGLGVFYGDHATEIVTPQMLSDVKGKIDSITSYVRDNIKTQSEESVNEFISKLSTENGWDKLSPTEWLEKLFNHVDIQRRLEEIKKQKEIIEGLKNA